MRGEDKVASKVIPRCLCSLTLMMGMGRLLKGLFYPASLARVVSWLAFVVAIFMGHEYGEKQRPAKRRHVQGMLDETEPLNSITG